MSVHALSDESEDRAGCTHLTHLTIVGSSTISVPLRPVSGIPLSMWLLWELRRHEGHPLVGCTYRTSRVPQVSRSLPSTTSVVAARRRERFRQIAILAVSSNTHTYFGIIASGMLRWVTFHCWKPGFSQLRLDHTPRTCGYQRRCIPSRFSAFRRCCLPLWVSPPGSVGVLESHLLSPFCPYGAIRYVPKRRTADSPLSGPTGVRTGRWPLLAFGATFG